MYTGLDALVAEIGRDEVLGVDAQLVVRVRPGLVPVPVYGDEAAVGLVPAVRVSPYRGEDSRLTLDCGSAPSSVVSISYARVSAAKHAESGVR